ncbi:hypothetical protein KKG46_04665 [Patescibacteria group bacterium]|nr:hypothetical protein [Patescibacteria group bacterium]
MSEISSPYDCEAYLLSFFARIVLRSWLQYEIILDIKMVGNYTCCFTLLSKLPDTTEEIVYQNDFRVSMNTILEIVTLENAVLPLKMTNCSPEHVLLEANLPSRRSTLPPPEFSDADAEINMDTGNRPNLYTQVNSSSLSGEATVTYRRPHPIAMLVACANTVDRTTYTSAQAIQQLDEEWNL